MHIDWKKYEKEIFDLFTNDFPEAEISHDVVRKGRYSKINRQIDILIEDYVAGNKLTIVIDAKFFSKKVDVKEAESFIGMLQDLGAHKGILITQKGYSQGAINRVYNDPGDIELEILNFEELKNYQGFGAIPFAESNCVILPAPFGWVIDGRKAKNWVACLYQRGLDVDQALKKHEFMYVQFWYRKKDAFDLDKLIEYQEQYTKKAFPTATFEYSTTIKRKDARTKLRIARIASYPGPEVTGFIEFKDFIFFCILLTPEEMRGKNTRKLENILLKVIPGNISHKSKF
jgi:hypothetical protein